MRRSWKERSTIKTLQPALVGAAVCRRVRSLIRLVPWRSSAPATTKSLTAAVVLARRQFHQCDRLVTGWRNRRSDGFVTVQQFPHLLFIVAVVAHRSLGRHIDQTDLCWHGRRRRLIRRHSHYLLRQLRATEYIHYYCCVLVATNRIGDHDQVALRHRLRHQLRTPGELCMTVELAMSSWFNCSSSSSSPPSSDGNRATIADQRRVLLALQQ